MKISLSENRKPTGEQHIKPTGEQHIKPTGEQHLKPTGEQHLKPTGEQTLRPFRKERERERIRYQNVIIPNYLYNEYPIHRQFVVEKEVINQNDYSNFFIIIIIILIVSSILIYTKI
jgi:hypothetical protein